MPSFSYSYIKADRRKQRDALGMNCPRCAKVRPKAHASILLPGQRCKVDGYRDPRARQGHGEEVRR